MKPRLLLAEDEDALATLLAYNLEKEGYDVARAADGEEALMMVQETPPDLLVLDWMMPNLSGMEVCRRLRAAKPTRALPILMLTARSDESDKVRGLDTGADDYLTKPFAMAELMARVRSLLRRAQPHLVEDRLEYGDIVLDRVAHRVRRAGRDVKLGPTEYRLLEHFMRNPGRVFSRERLLDAVWGSDLEVELRTVDVHIGRLRRATRKAYSMNIRFAKIHGALAALLAVPAFGQQVPTLPFEPDANFLKLNYNMNLGEVLGIAVNSKGTVVVLNHPGSAQSGPLFGNATTQLLEFDSTGKFVRELGKGVYGLGYAHSVRFDKYDNLWVVDKGTNSVMRFNPAGMVTLNLGRRDRKSTRLNSSHTDISRMPSSA